MSTLGGVFRCAVDGAVASFMCGLATYHVTGLVTFSVGGLGVFLMGGPVTFPMTRLVTFSVGVPGVYLGAGTVQVKCMFRCVVGGVITCFKGVLASFRMAGLVSAWALWTGRSCPSWAGWYCTA